MHKNQEDQKTVFQGIPEPGKNRPAGKEKQRPDFAVKRTIGMTALS
jgi:hypothetical protein